MVQVFHYKGSGFPTFQDKTNYSPHDSPRKGKKGHLYTNRLKAKPF